VSVTLISIRFDDEILDRVKALAEEQNVGYQTLLKMLVVTQLAAIEEAGAVEIPPEMRRTEPQLLHWKRKKRPPKPKAKKKPKGYKTWPARPDSTDELQASEQSRPEPVPAVVDDQEMNDLFSKV
jgi:hypothetical protein